MTPPLSTEEIQVLQSHWADFKRPEVMSGLIQRALTELLTLRQQKPVVAVKIPQPITPSQEIHNLRASLARLEREHAAVTAENQTLVAARKRLADKAADLLIQVSDLRQMEAQVRELIERERCGCPPEDACAPAKLLYKLAALLPAAPTPEESK